MQLTKTVIQDNLTKGLGEKKITLLLYLKWNLDFLL